MFSFVDRVFRGSDAKGSEPAPLAYVLGLKFIVHTRAEQNEVAELEDVIRQCGIPDIVLDKIEPGQRELSFWLHVANPKRAFKQLSEMPRIAPYLPTMQAAYAERTKMKFSALWPKGNQAHVPAALR